MLDYDKSPFIDFSKIETVSENHQKDLLKTENAISDCPKGPCGCKESGASTMLEIVRDMVKNKCNYKIVAWSDIYQTGKEIDDDFLTALNWVCIEEGLSDDDFTPSLVKNSHSWNLEICLDF